METGLLKTSRWRLASLWLSQVARNLADNWLRVFVVLELARAWSDRADQAWQVITLLWTLPAVVLAPFNGAICNSLPKHRVFVASAVVGLAVAALGLLDTVSWPIVWLLVALTFAIYG